MSASKPTSEQRKASSCFEDAARAVFRCVLRIHSNSVAEDESK